MALLSSKHNQNDNEMSVNFYYPTSKKALIIFTRNPELGKVKTRLAKTIGDEAALEIYKFLLSHTEKITKDLKVDKYLFYSENIHRDDLWNSDVFRKKLQKGEDLGERMQEAFSDLFDMGYERLVIIGSDVLELTQKELAARAGVRRKPVADDGFGRAESFLAGRHGVHLGGVDKVDAALERTAQDRVRIGLAHLFAESHGAQADGGDVQIALTEPDFIK